MKKIPLDPKSGGKCITVDALKPADLIVSTTQAAVSTGIKVGTLSSVSHAMLYTGSGNIIEAVGTGVRNVPLTTAINDASLAVAYRMTNLTPEEAALVVDYASKQIGKKYSTAGAVGAGVGRNPLACAAAGPIVCIVAKAGGFAGGGRFYCSQLVLAAFASINKPISPQRPAVSVPNDIPQAYAQGTLDYVGHLAL